MSRARLHLAWAGIALSVAFGADLQAQQTCRLGPPAVSAGQVSVPLSCRNGASDAGGVAYPAGTLFAGLTLFTLANASAGEAVYSDFDPGETSHLHLPAQEIKASGSSSIVFKFTPGKHTHFLVAVWDRKTACTKSPDNECPSLGYTLGRVDAGQLPMPIDVWPAPVCDVAKLSRRGFFAVTAKEELGALPSEVFQSFRTEYLTNDCWTYDPKLPGRGMSLRQWRLAPLRSG
jgi:hypothetical protein